MAIAAGYYHSLALRADGTVVGWGTGQTGQTNAPVELSPASTSVSGVVDANVPGSYTLTCWATNWLGSVEVATRTIVVVLTPPEIISLSLQPGPQFQFQGHGTAGLT